MATLPEPNVGGKLHHFLKKMSNASSYEISEKAASKISSIAIEPCSVPGPKLDPDEDDSDPIFSPIISAQLDTTKRQRPSVISLKISGKGLGMEEEKKLSAIRRYAGVLFALFATFSYSLATLMLKLFQSYHPFTISIWRFQGLILPSIPVILYYVCYEKKPIFDSVWPPTKLRTLKNIFFITLRSVIGCSSTVLQIYALQYMNMADASVVIYSSPVFVLFVARIFLGEKAGYFSVVIAIFTLAGVVIIARPPMLTGEPLDSNALLGIIFALACMGTATIVYVILRYLRDVHYSVVTMCYGIEGSIFCAVIAFTMDVIELPRTQLEWGLLVGLILFTWAAQTSLILALQLEQCGIVSLINSMDTCFAFILQFAFLGVIPDFYSITGASIVVVGVIVTTFRKYLAGLPEDDKTRMRFKIILQ